MREPAAPDLIVLADADNVGTALRELPAGRPARVAGARGPQPEVTPVQPAANRVPASQAAFPNQK